MSCREQGEQEEPLWIRNTAGLSPQPPVQARKQSTCQPTKKVMADPKPYFHIIMFLLSYFSKRYEKCPNKIFKAPLDAICQKS